MSESKTIKKMVEVNSRISRLISGSMAEENLQELKEATTKHGNYIDAAFKRDILKKWNWIEEAQSKLSKFLVKPYLEFDDFPG
jgi:glutamate synthase domain-containing protein 3